MSENWAAEIFSDSLWVQAGRTSAYLIRKRCGCAVFLVPNFWGTSDVASQDGMTVEYMPVFEALEELKKPCLHVDVKEGSDEGS